MKKLTEAQKAEQLAILQAKMNGTYVSGAMTARTEVTESVEAGEANENTGKDVAYEDEDGKHVARSGKWLANL